MMRFTILLLLLLTACGIPIDSEPRALDIEIETDIVDSAVGARELPVVVEIHLVAGDRLMRVTREIADSTPLTLVRSLLQGPVAAENALSIRSAIPPETDVLGITVSGGTATVDLSRDFTLVGGNEEILAVGQIVATVASLADIDGVILSIEGVPRPAPVAEGRLVDRPLMPSDFAELGGD